MPTIDGLISGFDTSSIISELLAFQRQPIVRFQERIAATTEKKAALGILATRLLALQGRLSKLTKGETFRPLTVTSSDDTVLTATAGGGLAAGTYRFKIRQLAQSEQYVSNGFAEATSVVGAGSLTVETGGGYLGEETELEVLNGGNGVRLGSVRITNRDGFSHVVDLSRAVTIDDVLEEINAVGSLNVKARLATTGDANPRRAIVLEDSTGGNGNLVVEEVNGGQTALDLGLLANGATSTLQGNSVMKLGGGLQLELLNDGLGVRTWAGTDLEIVQRDSTKHSVNLTGARTLQDVADRVRSETSGEVTIAIFDGHLVATDTSTGASSFSITNSGTSKAATDLGLTAAAAGGIITGDSIFAGFNSRLLKTLNGGSGVASGSIRITNRSGSSETIDLSSATTLQEVLDAINSNSISITAKIQSSGIGLELQDSSGGTGVLKVQEVASTAARDLGILEETGVSNDRLGGTDVNPRYINQNTLLSGLNNGRGVFAGKIRITDGHGKSFEVNLGSAKTIQDVFINIESAATRAQSDITVAINSKGNGIQLAGASGTQALKVEEVDGGTTAGDLNILGTAAAETPLVIDGAFEKTIAIDSDDTLNDVVSAINNLGLNVRASLVNDGSSINPVRLQLTGTETGELARVLVSYTGSSSLEFSRTSAASDAILFLGSTDDGSQPIVARSKTNTFQNIVSGLTLTVTDTSASEVVVTAARDPQKTKETVEEFVDAYNEVVDFLREETRFDAELGVRGVLVGDSVVRTVQRQLANAVSRRVVGLSSGQNLAANLGIRFLSDGKISFDSSLFEQVLASEPEAVERVFTQKRLLDTNTKLADFGNGQGVDTEGGPQFKIITRDETEIEVTVSGDKTVGDLIKSIETATENAGKVTVEIAADRRSLVLTDTTSGSEPFRVVALNSSSAFKELGLNKSADVSGGPKITGNSIDLTEDPGVALRVMETLDDLLDTVDGSVTRRQNFYQGRIEELQKRIERKEEILALREESLRRQFAQLEVLLGQNQNELTRLNAALSSLGGF